VQETTEIVAARSERRQIDAEAREAMEERALERTARELALDVRVGRGDHAHRHGPRPRRPERRDLARLERAQQHHLHVRRCISDLVEEERAPIGALERTDVIAVGAREGAACVTEELAGRERGGERCDVDGDEGSPWRAERREGACDELLARTALASHQDVRAQRRDRDDARAHLVERLRGAAEAEIVGRGPGEGRTAVHEHEHTVGELDDDAFFESAWIEHELRPPELASRDTHAHPVACVAHAERVAFERDHQRLAAHEHVGQGELTTVARDEHRRLAGELDPPAPARVEVTHPVLLRMREDRQREAVTHLTGALVLTRSTSGGLVAHDTFLRTTLDS
jgi:hypothetical protein